MQKLIQGIHRFEQNIFRANPKFYENLAKGQNPETLFISCSDSRVMPEYITQSKPGDLFVLRNAGNLVPCYGTTNDSGEAATIEYAVAALKVRDIIICGHTRCGAMQAIIHDPKDLNHLPQLQNWLNHAEVTRQIIQNQYAHLDLEAKWKAAVEENVLVQLGALRTHPVVEAALKSGQVKLHGWVFKIETGQIFVYDPTVEQFLPLTSTTMDGSAIHHPADSCCLNHNSAEIALQVNEPNNVL